MTGQDQWTSPRSGEDIEQLAEAWRYTFCCESEAAPDVLMLLEHKLPLIESSFTLRVEDSLPNRALAQTSFYPPEIWVTEATYQGALKFDPRCRFTLAHELAHVLLHSGRPLARAPERQSNIAPFRSSEWQANAFAAAFLMPRYQLNYYKNPMSAAGAMYVSVDAAENRMRALKIWPSKTIPRRTQNPET